MSNKRTIFQNRNMQNFKGKDLVFLTQFLRSHKVHKNDKIVESALTTGGDNILESKGGMKGVLV